MLPYCTQWFLAKKNGSNCSTHFSDGFICFQHVILLNQCTTFHLVVYCSLFQWGFVKQTSGTLFKTGLHQTVLLFQKPLRITAAEQNSGCCVKWSVHYRGQLTFQQFTQVHVQSHIKKKSTLDSSFLLSRRAGVCPVYHCCKNQTPSSSPSKAEKRRACFKLAQDQYCTSNQTKCMARAQIPSLLRCSSGHES